MFFSKDTSEHSKLGELMTFGNGKSRPKTDGPIPVYGGNGVLSYTDHHNIENAVLIGRVGAYCGSVYLEQGICWVSDNAIFAKSKITKDEFFDYFLLKRLNLFNHHVGTGQQLLTQEILRRSRTVGVTTGKRNGRNSDLCQLRHMSTWNGGWPRCPQITTSALITPITA